MTQQAQDQKLFELFSATIGRSMNNAVMKSPVSSSISKSGDDIYAHFVFAELTPNESFKAALRCNTRVVELMNGAVLQERKIVIDDVRIYRDTTDGTGRLSFLVKGFLSADDSVSLADYWELLERHDWYHAMSDDHRVYVAGEESLKKLQRIAGISPKHKELFEAFKDHYFTGKLWGNEQQPKPQKPA